MGGFLRFVTQGRSQAIGVSVLSLLMPPFSFVAGAVIGLVTLRNGVSEGVIVLVGSAAILAAAMWGLTTSFVPAVVFVVMTGLPALALCALLRATSSQGMVLAVAMLVAGGMVAAIDLLVADPAAWWGMWLEALFTARTTADPQTIAWFTEVLAPAMTGLPIAVMVTSMFVVFLARWGHAMLENPGGFGREFRALSCDRHFVTGTGVVAIIALLIPSREAGLGHDLLVLMVVGYALQGIAIVHALVVSRKGARGWIIAMYTCLALAPVTILALSAAGFSDAWFDYRTRFARSS